jgi:methylmalonyl-CoA mutase N-terminal domain/subunit
VMGGCQSLHTNSLDEAYALPSEHAVTIALRTQQVIAYESGVTEYPDPLGGSEYLEKLTDEIEADAAEYVRRIDEMGGMIPAIEANFPQGEIARASYEFQSAVEKNEQVIVGVNKFVEKEERPIELLQIDPAAEQKQVERLHALRKRRSSVAVERTLDRLRSAAHTGENTMPLFLDAVRAYATVGEICEALAQVFGRYTETSAV